MIVNFKLKHLKNLNYSAVTIKGFLLLAVMGSASCTKVEPWDRGNFAKASMQTQPWSIPQYLNNKTIEKALEESRGGTTLGGGGCGCG